ncbi:MAG: glycine--tRNA ligase [Promethearchaeota archaeon]|nr:MAG: glycine--tRNA ligase [Candidatus Lokiarchaeota archaeon]
MKIKDNIDTFNSLVKRRGFIWGPSPEIYGGLAGFYSYGPAGMSLKNNILSLFRRELNILGFGEVECPTVMPEIVWDASGHLERFIDPILKCNKCDSVYRADKFLKNQLPEKMIDGLSFEEMETLISDNNLVCPSCGNSFEKIEEYNLMLKTQVGTDTIAYLRPETATTTYLLFNRLDQVMRRQYPLKVFQYGKAYRNEISPRQGVLRMRSFDQFELQLFISKEQEYNFEEFEEVKEMKLPLLDWKMQDENISEPKMRSLNDAINNGILKKPAYAYCLFIAHHLTKKLGYSNEVMRYRQHSPNERAHYADDAWDLEIQTQQFGWVEICGIHDRTDYDLRRHGDFSKNDFAVSMGDDQQEQEIPQILEVAYGIDRIIYTLLETSFSVKKKRINLKLENYLAPNLVSVFPLVSNKKEIVDLAKEVHHSLQDNLINSFYDGSGSIGKRYRRQDELGTPYCITIDYDSLDDNAATIRDRDSMDQIRVKIEKIPDVIKKRLNESKI